MRPFPPRPDVPAEQRERGEAVLRYEDISQDGRLCLLGMPHAYGEVLFRQLLARHPMAEVMRRGGVVPILTRLVMDGTREVVSVNHPLVAEGAFEIAEERGPSGDVERIYLNLWAELSAPRARTFGPQPDGAGEPVVAGRVFAEHVFTRLFAAPDARKVTALELPGARRAYAPGPPDALLALPDGAAWIDDWHDDACDACFTLAHTDSNQHVNSLVYPRLFEEAFARRLAALSRSTRVLSRRVEVAYRRPTFAGERLQVRLRAFELAGGIGAVGSFTPPGGARPSVCAALLAEP
ncbi:MAG: hypothetical protein IT374_27870 [Polyangiaceae bacterium]|nr:hypothetical protein [Polyangiaceae bacterium]